MENITRAEENTQEVAQPEGAEINTQEVAQPGVADMDDKEFAGYIKKLQEGQAPASHVSETQKTEEEEEEKEEPFKTFKTEEEFQQFMNKTVGDRLKKTKDSLKEYEGYMARARAIYGTEENPLVKMLEDAEKSAAEEAGMPVEEFNRQKELERDANLYRAQKEAEKKEADLIVQKQEEWKREEAALKTVIPDFDFMKAMEDESFRKSVLEDGLTLSAAYIKKTSNIETPEKRQGVYEVGRGSGSGKTSGKVNPNEMSDSDFSRYIERLKDRG